MKLWRRPPDSGPGKPLVFLHPAGVQLDVGTPDSEDLETDVGAPGEPGPHIAGVAGPGVAGVAGQEPADREPGLVEERSGGRKELGGCGSLHGNLDSVSIFGRRTCSAGDSAR